MYQGSRGNMIYVGGQLMGLSCLDDMGGYVMSHPAAIPHLVSGSNQVDMEQKVQVVCPAFG
jgi:hypothetical protein